MLRKPKLRFPTAALALSLFITLGTALSPLPSAAQVSPPLAEFVDPLPIPVVKKPNGKYKGKDYYAVAMTQFKQKLHRDLPPTTVWGYDGLYPGKTIEARTGTALYVRWINSLPTKHLLPIDYTIHGAAGEPDVRNVVHLHGGHVPPESDGFPEDWFTPGHSALYCYPNIQQATTLWYHDHALGITRINVYAGLAAFYLIRDSCEDKLNLPKGKYEIPIVMQDRTFNANGSLFYPAKGVTHPVWVPEFFGDTAVVNGKVWPYLNVEPRKYRFRFLNGCNARFLRIRLLNGPHLNQIGTDGGFLPRPVQMTSILLSPAERADCIVDFARYKGRTITLVNDAPAPYPGGGEVAIPHIMQFRVGRTPVTDPSSFPGKLSPVTPIPVRCASVIRSFTLNELLNENGDPIVLLLNGLNWDYPITEKPKLGTAEIWRFINFTGDTHPMHLHLVQFQILDRQPIAMMAYLRDWNLAQRGLGTVGPIEAYAISPPIPPDPNERGWKDTVRSNPSEITRIIARFTDYTGRYVWHCHILEHEDNEMMRPFEVVR